MGTTGKNEMYRMYTPNYFDSVMESSPHLSQSLTASALKREQLWAKRLLDVSLASIALFLVLPILALVAIAIRLDSEGPIFFRQKRVGMNGKLFTIYKFRSMVVNAEALQAQVNQTDAKGRIIHKCKDDPRVTRVGRIIRKLSLDELPQLFNVLKGDMSLVGPRPELPWLVQEYASWQRRRFMVPQGITGWWQIQERSDAPLHLNTHQDIYYIEHYSLWLDVKIILLTIPALLKQKGAF